MFGVRSLALWSDVLPAFKFKAITDDSLERSGVSVDELGRTSTFQVGGEGYVVESRDAAGHTTVYERNAAGLPTRIIVKTAGDAQTIADTSYDYDDDYNLIRVDHFDGTHETWAYEPVFGQMTEHVDQLGRKTVYVVNGTTGNTTEMRSVVGLNDTQSTEHNDVVVQYEYETDGLLKRAIELHWDVTGAAQTSGVTQHSYTTVTAGGAGHVGRWLQSTTVGGDNPSISGITIINPGVTQVISRNAYGMPATVRDPMNRDTQLVHDNLDRLTQVTAPNPGSGQHQPVVEYAYTLAGLLQDESALASAAARGIALRLTTILTSTGGSNWCPWPTAQPTRPRRAMTTTWPAMSRQLPTPSVRAPTTSTTC